MKEFWLAEMIKFKRTFLFSELLSKSDFLQEFFEFTALEYFEQKNKYAKFGIFVNPDILPVFFLFFLWKIHSVKNFLLMFYVSFVLHQGHPTSVFRKYLFGRRFEI